MEHGQPSVEHACEQDGDDDDALLADENAFGIWVSWFDAEEVEYAQSADKFPPRIVVFRSAVADFLEREPLGDGVRALDWGTAVYVEVGDGDQTTDLLAWVRRFRGYLQEGGWETFAVVAHGGCWVAKKPESRMLERVGNVYVLASFGPSEPYRKVMAADVLAHDDDDSGEPGWGVGLFVDVDALDAMGRKLKNAPTPMWASGARFYRLGS